MLNSLQIYNDVINKVTMDKTGVQYFSLNFEVRVLILLPMTETFLCLMMTWRWF